MWGIEATVVVIAVVFGIGLFILLREVACWYFKINVIVQLLERIADKIAPEAPYVKPEELKKGGRP